MAVTPTWDDLSTATWDQIYTWDDPMLGAVLDVAYASGSIMIDAPSLAINWMGDAADETLFTELAHDTFYRSAAVVAGLGTTKAGQPWSISRGGGGADADYSEDGTYGKIKPSAVGVFYTAYLGGMNKAADFDVAVLFNASLFMTGEAAYVSVLARFSDVNNTLRFRADVRTDQTIGYAFDIVQSGSPTLIAFGGVPDLLHQTSSWYWLRAQGIGAALRMKIWDSAKPQPEEWIATFTDTVYPGVAGWVGFAAQLGSLTTNTLPYDSIRFAEFWSGANGQYPAGNIVTGLSLDDGFPNEATNTNNIGVSEASADLLGPIGTAPDLYFGTFRSDQPLVNVARDVAGVAITTNVVAADGIRSIRLFTGQMSDIPLSGRSAKMTGISAARLKLSTLIQVPAVHGYYEGSEATWLIAYALFKSGLYVAPPPGAGCRWYLPMNGSLRPYIPDESRLPVSLTRTRYLSSIVLITEGNADNAWMRGPFTAAPNLALGNALSASIRDYPQNVSLAPGSDMFSQSGSTGRWECWIKGDPHNVAGSFDTGASNLMRFYFFNGGVTRYMLFGVGIDRRCYLQMRDGVSGLVMQGPFLPTDGQWHFFGAAWDVAAGTVNIILDAATYNFTGLPFLQSNLAAVDDITQNMQVLSYLPIVEVRLTTGRFSQPAAAPWASQLLFDPDVVMRRSDLTMSGFAEPEPREAFELLSSLAQSELASTGFDAFDRYLYLPLTYWGETQQQFVAETLAASTNLGADFEPIRPVKRIYNQVVVQYKQRSVQEIFSTQFQSSQLIAVPPLGSVTVLCQFSNPLVEIRGLTIPVMSQAALAAAPPSVTNAINYITLNTAEDGTGTDAVATDIVVSVQSWTPGAATVLFRNLVAKVWYVANNVSIPPFGLSGKAMISVDAVASAESASSITARGKRVLSTSLSEIQTSDDAASVARTLVGFLAFPRTTFTSSAFADARRQPGRLVQVDDADGTGLSGFFRLTGITTAQDGARLQQALAGEQAWSLFVWGVSNWGEAIWGEGT